MRETRVKVTLKWSAGRGFLFEPIDANKDELFELISKGKKLLLEVENYYEKPKQNIRANKKAGGIVGAYARLSAGTGHKFYPEPGPR